MLKLKIETVVSPHWHGYRKYGLETEEGKGGVLAIFSQLKTVAFDVIP